MPNWKKVILSGSNAVLNQISASTVPGSSTNGEDLIGYDANTGGFVTIAQGNLESVTDTDWHIDGNFLTSSKGVNITGSITASGGASFLDNLVLINDHTSTELHVEGNITASDHISASGMLFASLSLDSSSFRTVMYDTASGKFFFTGSYGGGGGGGGNAYTTIKIGDGTTYSDLTAGSDSEILRINTGSNISASSITNDVATNTDEFTINAIPTGSDSHIQYNDSGLFGGTGSFVFNDVDKSITVGNIATATNTSSPTLYQASPGNPYQGEGGVKHQMIDGKQLSTNAAYAPGRFDIVGLGRGTLAPGVIAHGVGTPSPSPTPVTFGTLPAFSNIAGGSTTVGGDLFMGNFYGVSNTLGNTRLYVNGVYIQPGSPAILLEDGVISFYPSASVTHSNDTSGSVITPLSSASGKISLTEASNPINSTFDIIGRKNTQFQTGESGSEENYMIYNNSSDVIGLGGKGLTVSDLSNTSSAADKIYFHDPLTANSAVSFKQDVNFTPTAFNSTVGNNNTIFLAGNIGTRQGTLATYPNNKQRFTPKISFTLGGGGNPGGGGPGRPFFDIDDSDLQIAKSGSEDIKGGILLTPNPNIFFFNETDASASISGSLIPDSASAQIKFDTGSSALKFFAGSTTETLKEVLHISKSGDNPRIGIGTSTPLRAFDFKEVRDDNRGGEILIRGSRTTKGAENNDEVGRINFAIDSSSFGNIDTSGSAAEIVAIVDDIDQTGVRGSLSLRVSQTKTDATVEKIRLNQSGIHFTGSAAFNNDVTIGDDLTVSDFALLNAVRIGSTATDPGDGVLHVEDYGVFVGGLKIGSSEDPGANNLIVDGTTTLKGITTIGDVTGDTLTVSGSNFNLPSVVNKSSAATTDDILILDGDRVKKTPQTGLPYISIHEGVIPGGSSNQLLMFSGSSGTKKVKVAPGVTHNTALGYVFSGAGTTTDIFAGNMFIGLITASGNISSSGDITAANLDISGNVDIDGTLSLGGFADISASLATLTAGGSDDLGNHTATTTLNLDGNPITSVSTITATGNIETTGDIIANRYIVSSSVTHLTQSFSSGSTIFGDSIDDTHKITGSLLLTGSEIITGELTTNTLSNISTTLGSDSTTNVDTFNSSSYNGAIYDYILKDTGVGARVGQFMVAHDDGSVTFTDTSTKHLSDSTIPEITADINNSDVRIRITNGNGYTFKAFVKKL